jgi:S-DNA-T family DNA segregation ATPase FtsK/SpoIIIE
VFNVMDIVVRTPHGDADVSIVATTATTTLGDVISAITGQAVPRLALIDGRPVDAGTQFTDAGLTRGAVVTTEPAAPATVPASGVEVVQLAGQGAGRIMQLDAGTYRFGPGRRANADELEPATVGQVVFEVLVEATAGSTDVMVTSRSPDVALDGSPVSSPARWRDRTLTAGSRAFQIQIPTRVDPAEALSLPDNDGNLAFSRPPRRRSAPERRPVIDALREATVTAPTLWERRPDHHDAFVLPFGITIGPSGAANTTVDLGSDRALAIAGSERVRSALARTLIVEAATLHGPADLDIVVLTHADRLAAWDWAKWLPHVHLDGPAAIWTSPDDIARWVERTRQPTEPATMSQRTAHLTLVVVDDPDLWNRRDAPLRPLLSKPPDDLRLITLCADAARAPAICTTLIAETDDGRMRLHSFTSAGDVGGIRPALTEEVVAARIARALAPLVDIELPAPNPATPDATDQLELAELIGLTTPADVIARWNDATPRSTVPIGRSKGRNVDIDVADDVTLVVGPSMGDAFDVAATALLAQGVDRAPCDLWIVPALLDRGERSEVWWRFPHATAPHDTDLDIEPQRLTTRVRALLADPSGPARIVLVAESASATRSSADPETIAALVEVARTIDGVALLVISDQPSSSLPTADTMIRVERRDGANDGSPHRIATVVSRSGSGDSGQPCLPVQPPAIPDTTLELRPAVIGRSLTPLERRLELRWAESSNVASPEVVAAIDVLRDAASQHHHRSGSADDARIAVPPPMPTHLDLDDLFTEAPGDGVPLGVADDPSVAAVRTHWWEPASGSLLLFGSRRSGIEHAVTTVAVGIADRFPGDDVRLIVVEASSTRRRALSSLDRDVRVVAPDQADEVAAALDDITSELARHQHDSVDGATPPRLVVLISDLAALRQRTDEHLVARIDEVLVDAAAPDSGVDVVAYAAALDSAGPFAMAATSRLIGASSNRFELSALGVDDVSDLGGVTGRCRSFPSGDMVQLALSDSTAESLLEHRGSSR